MNTKTYKQAFVVLAVGMFIVPQVAFAAWWNPLSWGIFRGSGTETQTLETRANDPEITSGGTASSTTSENKEGLQKLTNETPKVTNSSWWNPFSWSVFKKSSEISEIEKLRSEVEELKKKTAAPDPIVVGDKNKATTKPVTPVSKPAISVSELKQQAPQEFKALVEENKTQLLEASKLLSNKNIIARVKPSVVYIETTDGSGSGVIVGADGYILTNAHVVSGANSATVKLSNGGSFNGTVVGRDENIDLALIKISATGLSAAFLGDSDLVEQGDSVFTFGYPLGIEGDVAFKDGTLSRRTKIDGTTYLEISAQILPGNSGGPLVNQSGEVIGINTLAIGTLKISGVLIGETLKFALPINVAKNLIPELKNGRNVELPKKIVIEPVIPEPAPRPTPRPLPTPEPTPAPSCTRDTWDCSDWSECSSSGSQTRACDITFDCSVANTPSPNTTRSCTPPPPPEPKISSVVLGFYNPPGADVVINHLEFTSDQDILCQSGELAGGVAEGIATKHCVIEGDNAAAKLRGHLATCEVLGTLPPAPFYGFAHGSSLWDKGFYIFSIGQQVDPNKVYMCEITAKNINGVSGLYKHTFSVPISVLN